ncbi:MAG: DUF1648 domain-containing protein [Candidatus Nezhaarchaeales archaeon]
MEPIEPRPLTRRGVALAWLIVLELIVIWVLAIYSYLTLPQVVPVHFGWNGEPTRYGEKIELLFLAVPLSIAPSIFLLITKYRFTLINKYSYLVNLPAFFTYITKIPKERRSLWVNRYFESLLAFGAAITFFLLLIEYEVYLSALQGRVHPWLVFVPLTIVGSIIPLIFYLRRLSQEMKLEAEGALSRKISRAV